MVGFEQQGKVKSEWRKELPCCISGRKQVTLLLFLQQGESKVEQLAI
jgi:hypothetical protein